MQCVTLPRITELNPHLLCVLCGGYLIDATSITECLHAFCKSCIVRYLETHKYCPICDVLVHKTEPLQNIRPDVIRQSIVYKLVPNLYKKEMRNRRNFYVQVNPQQHPACSESKGEITESSTFFSLDDLINLSLEYVNSMNEKNFFSVAKGSKRYFRCRAAVTVRSLRKLLAAKYALGVEHKIHLFLDGIQLPDHFRLLDIAYISSWKRVGYIRILYEILTSDRNVLCAEKIDLCEPEALTDESKVEVKEDTNAVVPVVNANTEECEDSRSVLKVETMDVETSITSHQSPLVTVDLTSPSSKVTYIDIPSQPKEDVIITNSSVEPSPLAASSAHADEGIPPVAKEVVVASVDLTDVQPCEKTDLSQSIESSTDIRQESSTVSNQKSNTDSKGEHKVTEETSVAETPDKVAVETVASVAAKGSEKSLPAAPSKVPPEAKTLSKALPEAKTLSKAPPEAKTPSKEPSEAKTLSEAPSELKDVAPVKSLAPKETPKSASSKKERRGDRSESLPPVPALRKIDAAPPKTAVAKPATAKQATATAKQATTITKPLTATPKPITTKSATGTSKLSTTTVASNRSQPVVSIPRIPTSRMTGKSTGGYPVASVAAPLSLIPPPIAVATDLISLYAKSPIVRHPVPKKPPPTGLSILRIDPNTLSPIEASSSPATAAMVPASGGSRKMLPCRPITTSAYNSVYSCAGANPLHPFGKFSSPPPLYPPFPPSSLHPMNELVRRMFPFPFGSIDAALKAPPLDPTVCAPLSYPQSMTSAVSHFLTAGKPTTPPKPTKGEKGRRKPTQGGPHAALNGGGEKAPFKGGAADPSHGYRRANAAALANGQVKSAVKRKSSELSDFSINNLIPVDDGAKRAPPSVVHACTADGVNEVCDQVQPVSAAPRNESRKSS